MKTALFKGQGRPFVLIALMSSAGVILCVNQSKKSADIQSVSISQEPAKSKKEQVPTMVAISTYEENYSKIQLEKLAKARMLRETLKNHLARLSKVKMVLAEYQQSLSALDAEKRQALNNDFSHAHLSQLSAGEAERIELLQKREQATSEKTLSKLKKIL